MEENIEVLRQKLKDIEEHIEHCKNLMLRHPELQSVAASLLLFEEQRKSLIKGLDSLREH